MCTHVKSGECVMRIYLKVKTPLHWRAITFNLFHISKDSKVYQSIQS
jgi:hypothetical protein